jgi:endonuclease V-like protein UPF0215 family
MLFSESMKSEIRLLGIDDGPFSLREAYAIIIGVVMRGGRYIEGVLCRNIQIDGWDATDICIDMVQHTRHRQQLKAALIDGVSLAGFNVVDIERMFNETELPVITVTRDEPDMVSIEQALRIHFPDWKKRLNILKKGFTHQVETAHTPIYIKIAGIEIERAKEIITLSTIRGVIPEPIRTAHIIASGVMRGESYGKA